MNYHKNCFLWEKSIKKVKVKNCCILTSWTLTKHKFHIRKMEEITSSNCRHLFTWVKSLKSSLPAFVLAVQWKQPSLHRPHFWGRTLGWTLVLFYALLIQVSGKLQDLNSNQRAHFIFLVLAWICTCSYWATILSQPVHEDHGEETLEEQREV